MNIRKRLTRASAAAALAIGFCSLSVTGVEARNIVISPDADFSSMPYTISFDGGAATYTFTYVNDGLTANAVSTGGSALVNSILGTPIPFGLGTPIGDNGYEIFTAFSSPADILYSISEDSIGLKFLLPDGVHYGYVTTLGPEVIQYGFNDTPGASIATGAAAPEPATWVMLILGLGFLGALGRQIGRRSLA
jgi:PEP-CTERM motif-containing protein